MAAQHDASAYGAADVPDTAISVDVDAVEDVAAFYRRTALVADAAAADMADHDFGSWAVGENYRALGARYADMGRAMSEVLRGHAAAAADLADALATGVTALADADDGQRREIEGLR